MKEAKQPDGKATCSRRVGHSANYASGTSGTTNAGAAASGTPQQVTSSGAAGIQDMVKTMPYVLGSIALGGMFLFI